MHSEKKFTNPPTPPTLKPTPMDKQLSQRLIEQLADFKLQPDSPPFSEDQDQNTISQKNLQLFQEEEYPDDPEDQPEQGKRSYKQFSSDDAPANSIASVLTKLNRKYQKKLFIDLESLFLKQSKRSTDVNNTLFSFYEYPKFLRKYLKHIDVSITQKITQKKIPILELFTFFKKFPRFFLYLFQNMYSSTIKECIEYENTWLVLNKNNENTVHILQQLIKIQENLPSKADFISSPDAVEKYEKFQGKIGSLLDNIDENIYLCKKFNDDLIKNSIESCFQAVKKIEHTQALIKLNTYIKEQILSGSHNFLELSILTKHNHKMIII